MNTKRQFLLGIFFLAALSILAFYTLFLTDFTLFGEPEKELVYFPRANFLRVGDPVLVSGMRIGRVGAMDHDLRREPEKRIQAVLNLDEKLEIHEGYKIEIQESTMLGGRHVEIDPGLYDGPAAVRFEDGGLQGVVQQNPIASLGVVGDLVTENAETFKRFLDNLDFITADMKTMVADVRAGKGMAGRLFADEDLAEDITVAAKSIREVSTDIQDMSADVKAGKGLLGALLYDEELVATAKGTIRDLKTMAEDLRAGKGTAGKLLYDEELAAEVDKGIRGLSTVVAGLEAGDGLLGRLLSDELLSSDVTAIVANLKSTSADIRDVAATLRAGEGSAGRLLMSSELYDEAYGAVKLLTRSLEDYREAAPITAFTSVLFTGF